MKLKENPKIGHFLALFSVFVWASVFVSNKILLEALSPSSIVILRFAIGFLCLFIVHPKMLKWQGKNELWFVAAGLCGVGIYSFLEIYACDFTSAGNVGLIMGLIPCVTAIGTALVFKEKDEMNPGFFAGFVVAMIGVGLVSFTGDSPELNPIGDLMAVAAVLVWVAYTLMTRVVEEKGYSTIEATQRMFIYGLIFMIPVWLLIDEPMDFAVLKQGNILLNLLFVGVLASAATYLTWSGAVNTIGPVKTALYVYLSPIITIVVSVLVLHETVSSTAMIGIVLTLIGTFVSGYHRQITSGIKRIFNKE